MMQRRDAEEAQRLLARACAGWPGDVVGCGLLSVLHEECGDPDVSSEAITAATARHGGSPSSVYSAVAAFALSVGNYLRL